MNNIETAALSFVLFLATNVGVCSYKIFQQGDQEMPPFRNIEYMASSPASLIPWQCLGIPFVSREQWGAQPPKSVEYINSTDGVPYVFYHHTAGRECFAFDTCARVVRWIQKFHQIDRGWDDNGYTFFVGGDGRVYEGRGWDRVGAHTRGYNDKSVAIAFIGHFSNRMPSGRMLIAAQRLIDCGIALKKIRANYTLHGHRDANCTECPGRTFYDFMRMFLPHFAGRLQHFVC